MYILIILNERNNIRQIIRLLYEIQCPMINQGSCITFI